MTNTYNFLYKCTIVLVSKNVTYFPKHQGPVVLVPTTYYTTPTDKFREWGASVIIWANHSVRASVLAMQNLTSKIYRDQSVANVEKEV